MSAPIEQGKMLPLDSDRQFLFDPLLDHITRLGHEYLTINYCLGGSNSCWLQIRVRGQHGIFGTGLIEEQDGVSTMTTKKRPIEDPSRLVAFTDAVASLEWAPSAYRASAETLFRRLSDLTQAEILYYYGRRCASRSVSKSCRFLAWSLGTIGLLIPLIQPMLGPEAPAHFLSWGYIAFGAGGAVMIFDTVFAGTQAHQRYTATQLELEKVYTVFALEWQAQLVKLAADSSPTSALEVIGRAVAFASELHRVMGAETSAWQETVNKALAELKGKIDGGKAKAE